VSTHTDTAAITYVHNLQQQHSLQAPEIQLETKVRFIALCKVQCKAAAAAAAAANTYVHNLQQQHSLQAPEIQLETKAGVA
jgi:hypothetical protein